MLQRIYLLCPNSVQLPLRWTCWHQTRPTCSFTTWWWGYETKVLELYWGPNAKFWSKVLHFPFPSDHTFDQVLCEPCAISFHPTRFLFYKMWFLICIASWGVKNPHILLTLILHIWWGWVGERSIWYHKNISINVKIMISRKAKFKVQTYAMPVVVIPIHGMPASTCIAETRCNMMCWYAMVPTGALLPMLYCCSVVMPVCIGISINRAEVYMHTKGF